MSKKILTLHPEGKNGVNIDESKYNQINKALLDCLAESGKSQTYSQLVTAIESKLGGSFEGSIAWYTETVKLDLEARKVIKHNRKSKEISLA